MTNLIIANVETLSHDDGYRVTLTAFLQTVISLGAMASWPPLDPPLLVYNYSMVR